MTAAAKRRTSITVAPDLLEAAREFDLNVSALAETALAAAVREARARAWTAENAEALEKRRALIEREGPPLAAWQAWTPEG